MTLAGQPASNLAVCVLTRNSALDLIAHQGLSQGGASQGKEIWRKKPIELISVAKMR
jgi:hypothetical protein